MKLASLSLRRPVTVIMLFFALFVVGLIAVKKIPVEFLPQVSQAEMWIQFPYSGSTPRDIERDILIPAEDALSTLPYLKNMWARASVDGAGISLQFENNADMKVMYLEVRDRLDRIRSKWPADFENYFIWKENTSNIPILWAGIVNKSNKDIKNIKEILEREIRSINGVSKVDIEGTPDNSIIIAVDEMKMKQYRISQNQLMNKLSRNNMNYSVGEIESDSTKQYIRIINKSVSLETFKKIPITTSANLEDIASVYYALPDDRNYSLIDGTRAIWISVNKESAANSVAISKSVQERLNKLSKKYNLQVAILFNQGDTITESLNNLITSGVWGASFAVIILFFFLRKIKMTLVIAFEIPLCIIFTLGIMYFAKVTLNLISMTGLIISAGMLVDNAIVVSEAIYKRREDGYSLIKAILKGSKEIGLAVILASLTTMIVFIPMLIEKGEMGIYLRFIGATIIIALSISLISSLLLIPLFSKLLVVTPGAVKDVTLPLKNSYKKIVQWTLAHRVYTMIAVIGFIIASFFPIINMKTGGPPQGGDGGIRIRFWNYGGLTQKEMFAAIKPIEQDLIKNKDKYNLNFVVLHVRTRGMSLEIFPDKTKIKQQKAEDMLREYVNKLPPIAGLRVMFGWGHQTGGGRSTLKGVFNINIYGKNYESLYTIAEGIEPLLRKVPTVTEVDYGQDSETQELQIVIDRDKTSSLGLNNWQILSSTSSYMRSRKITSLETPDGDVDVNLQRKGLEDLNMQDLKNSTVVLNDGSFIGLQDITSFNLKPSLRMIFHNNRVTNLNITLTTTTEDYKKLRSQIDDALTAYDFPKGYGISYGEEFRNMDENMGSLMTNLVLAIFLVYMVMAALFESLNMPFAIIAALPLGIFGVFWGLFITGTAFDMMAQMGLLILIGIAVNNGIIIIDHINRLRIHGMNRHDALIQGGLDRLRPVIMTTLTTVIGIVPMALGTQDTQYVPYTGMGRVVVFGLITSTIVTLILLPVIYSIIDDVSEFHVKKLRAIFAKKNVPVTESDLK